MSTTFIYSLIDPTINEVRYIGKSNDPLKRLSRHITNANSDKKKTHCYAWIKGLLNKNLKPLLNVLEECSEEVWGEREDYWISKFDNLTNLIDGGKFCPMLVPEIREKMRKSSIGKRFSDKTKAKLSAIRKEEWANGIRVGGWHHSKEIIENKKEDSIKMWANRSKEERMEIGKKISIGLYKKINQYSMQMKFIKTWTSVKEAELFYCGKNKGHMKRQINNNKPWKGFYWKYEASDPILLNEIDN